MEIVDIDLEKFFDRVNHDKLMSEVAKRIEDKRVLKLIRRYLNSGVMEDGLVKPREEGTPQGSPLSYCQMLWAEFKNPLKIFTSQMAAKQCSRPWSTIDMS